jgi:hypothetical protein
MHTNLYCGKFHCWSNGTWLSCWLSYYGGDLSRGKATERLKQVLNRVHFMFSLNFSANPSNLLVGLICSFACFIIEPISLLS